MNCEICGDQHLDPDESKCSSAPGWTFDPSLNDDYPLIGWGKERRITIQECGVEIVISPAVQGSASSNWKAYALIEVEDLNVWEESAHRLFVDIGAAVAFAEETANRCSFGKKDLARLVEIFNMDAAEYKRHEKESARFQGMAARMCRRIEASAVRKR